MEIVLTLDLCEICLLEAVILRQNVSGTAIDKAWEWQDETGNRPLEDRPVQVLTSQNVTWDTLQTSLTPKPSLINEDSTCLSIAWSAEGPYA